MDSTFLAQIFVSVVYKSFQSTIATLLKLLLGMNSDKKKKKGERIWVILKTQNGPMQQYSAYGNQAEEHSIFTPNSRPPSKT